MVPLALMAMTLGAVQLATREGWRINLTESEPLGFYRLRPLQDDETLSRGTKVELCPPAWVTPRAFPFYLSGDCPGGGMPMLKTVVGVPGDSIVGSLQGVWINGRELPNSGQLLRTAAYPWIHLPHQQGRFVLGKGQYWVYGSGARPALAAQSFDSRYWGAIDIQQIRGMANAGG
ncbi:putative Type IV secretory pathway, protease TraF [Thiomonas sp. X19]|nr:putative Type IV secretory pathway, protease TraF [Thiomonas sp. X19]